MGIARSTDHRAPAADRDAKNAALIEAICAEFEAYGYRRVTAELRHQGQLGTQKRVRRLMRSMACRRSSEGATSLRRTATTTSRSSPPVRRHGLRWTNQLGGGHHLRRHCDRLRRPRRDPGCLVTPGCRLRDQPLDRCPSHHRGARRGGSLTGASRGLRASQSPRLALRGSRLPQGCLPDSKLAGSMGRRGNPYDNAKAESFMKTLKVEAVYPMAYETVDEVMADLPRFIDHTTPAGCTQLSATAAPSTSRINTPSAWSKPQHDAVHRKGAHSRSPDYCVQH